MKLHRSLTIYLAFIGLSLSSVSKANDFLWMWCNADSTTGEKVYIHFSNMVYGAVSLSGEDFIESLIAWDGNGGFHPERYDTVSFGSSVDFRCEGKWNGEKLQTVKCRPRMNRYETRASFMEGINPSSTVDSRLYGKRFSFELNRADSDRYLVKVQLGKRENEPFSFTFTQTIENLTCQLPSK